MVNLQYHSTYEASADESIPLCQRRHSHNQLFLECVEDFVRRGMFFEWLGLVYARRL
jgi:hypothetical protein